VKHSEDFDDDSSSDLDEAGHGPGRVVGPRWVAPVGLAIGVLALMLTLVQWVYPPSRGGAAASFSGQQIKDAKTRVCASYKTVHRAVSLNTHLEPSPDNGPLTVATSARLALYGGGGYLRDLLAREQATPADLAKAVNSLATTLQDLGINYLADVPGFVQDQVRHNLDGQLEEVDGLCK